MAEKKDTYRELFTYQELLTNLLNGKKQEIALSLVDIRFLEILHEADPNRTVPNDEGQQIPILKRIEELKVGVRNVRARMHAIKDLLEEAKEESKIEDKLTDESLAPRILDPEALKGEGKQEN